MKKFLTGLALAAGTLLAGGCSKKEAAADNPPAATADVRLYQPSAGASSNEMQLQMTIVSGKLQYSTLGRFSGGTAPQPAEAALAFDGASGQQTMILLDAQQQPAFAYGVDVATGERKPGLVEFVPVNATTTLIRLYNYSWATRLGTLLLETRAEQTVGGYTFTKMFENANPNAGNRPAAGTAALKQNVGFPAPIPRLDLGARQRVDGTPTTTANGATATQNADLEDFVRNGFGSSIGQVQRLMNYISTNAGPVAGVAAVVALVATSTTVVAAGTAVFIAAAALSSSSWAISRALGVGQSILRGHSGIPFTPGYTGTFNEPIDGTATNVTVANHSGYDFDVREHLQAQLAEALHNTTARMTDVVRNLRTAITTRSDLDDLPDTNGVLQFGLAWNTATDIDLWVTDPSGEKIYYAHRNSAAGGYLDRDDTDGFGPENIYYRRNIPDGAYLVQAHYYGPSSGPSTEVTLKVSNGLSFTRSRTLTLATQNATVTAFTVRKAGAVLTAQ